MNTENFNKLLTASKAAKADKIEAAIKVLKENFIVKDGNVKPNSWWTKLFWSIIKDFVVALLQILVIKLETSLEVILGNSKVEA